jgi:hypothetical protein
MVLYLECRACKSEPNFEAPGLERGVSISACSARGHSHLGISEQSTCMTQMITGTPITVKIPIDNIRLHSSTEVVIPTSMRLNISVDRLAASVTGVVTKSLAGQGSLSLNSLFTSDLTLTPILFGAWKDPSATMGFSNPRIVTETGEQLSVRFESTPTEETDYDTVMKVLTDINEAAWNSCQNVFVYNKAPTLHKCIIAVPVGIVGCGYTLASCVVDKDCALSTDALESSFSAAIRRELNNDPHKINEFYSACGIDAAQWAGVVMTSLSMISSWLIPYKADEKSMMLPNNGVGATAAEYWLEEPMRIGLAGDCEDSASFCTSCIYKTERLFSDVSAGADTDVSLLSKFPTLLAVYRSLAYYKVGVAVIAANAGNVDDSTKATTADIAGHAMVVATPLTHLCGALKAGGECEETHIARRAQLFSQISLPHRLPETEVQSALNGDLDQQIGKLPGLACEGTGPSNSSMQWENDPRIRHNNNIMSVRKNELTNAISPSIAMPVRELNTGSENQTHQFYQDIVELHFRPNDLNDIPLGNLAAAACHFAVGTARKGAGVDPDNFATGNFIAVSRWSISTDQQEIIRPALEKARTHNLPPSGSVSLTQQQNDIFGRNMQLLSALNVEMQAKASHNPERNQTKLCLIVPFSGLTGNAMAVDNMVALMKEHPGRVETTQIPSIAHFGTQQLGVFSTITLW